MEISNLMKKRVAEYLKEGKRTEERGLLDYRSLKIETGVSKNAEGSAKVTLGDTVVIAGVKLDATEPYPDDDEAGTLVTTAELLPLSSPRFESGPPTIEAVEIARIIDRGIRESGFIDMHKLCIKKGEKVWSVFLDIFPLNDDGNLIDACFLAAVAALKTAKLPKYDEEAERVKFGEWTTKNVPLADLTPITMTFFKIGKNIILDPTREEEESSDARISLALTKENGKIEINSIQKGNEEPLSEEELFKIFDLAAEKYEKLHKRLEDELAKAEKERKK